MGRIGKSLAYRTAKSAMVASMDKSFTMWVFGGKTFYFVKGKLNGVAEMPLLTKLYEAI